MAGKTVANIRTLAQTFLDEPGNAISTAQWLAIINAANGRVYRMIVDANPEYFITSAGIVFPANTLSITVSSGSYLNELPYKIGAIWSYGSSSPSATLVPVKLSPMRMAEIPMSLAGSPESWWPLLGTGTPANYILTGEADLLLAPVSATAVNLTIHYIRPCPALTSDSSIILNDKAEDFGDAVAYCAAYMAGARSGGTNRAVAQLWADAQEEIKNSAPRRNADEPWLVRYVP